MRDLPGSLIDLALFIVAAPALLACGYLSLLTLLSARQRSQPRSKRLLRFDVVVPAHDEAAGIARTVANLRQLDWPAERFRVLVIADNCSDDTAAIARAGGAEIFQRTDPARRGKGYALAHAFDACRAKAWSDAIVVIDADAVTSANLLEAFAIRIENGAAAVQAHYGVLNPGASWRTRLMTIALSAFHMVRSRARERLGLSCGIRGNGWCVTRRTLELVPYRAFSLAEDLEYAIELGLAGLRVVYADEARSDADMVSGEQIAGKQRQRWEDGRFKLIRSKAATLLLAALRRRSAVCLDLALDLLVLPLSYIVLNVAVLMLLAAIVAWRWPSHQAWVWLAAACAVSLIAYVMRGWQLSGVGARGLWDLARAPGFLLWKIVVMLRRRTSNEWTRTEREKR